MLVDKQSELMSDLLFTVHQHGGDDVMWKPPMVTLICYYSIICWSSLFLFYCQQLQLHDLHYTGDSTFLPGPFQHNKKFACVFLPCAVPLFYIGGELYVYLSRYFDSSTKSQGGGVGD